MTLNDYYRCMPIKIEVTPILPPANFALKRIDAMAAAVENALKGKINTELKGELDRRAEGWSDPPKWNSKVSKYTLVLSTRSKKWLWVSGGTRARAIFPKRKKFLAIRGYVPKTKPTGHHNMPGAGRDGSYVFAKSAPGYPGIKARSFEEKIVKLRTMWVNGVIQAAIDGA